MPLGLTTAKLNFDILEEIGQEGKNSNVYLAHDKQLDGRIVVKRIEKSKIINRIDFYNESKVLYSSSHQNVVRVYYGCEDDDYIYIAMPFYHSGSLKKLIDSRFLTVREIIRYSIQFLSGIHHIHSKNLIHFDIKPDNILLSESNEALVSDFGLAKAMNSVGFTSPDQIYSKQLPPEALVQSEYSIHFDIYQSGVTIYRMCNGNLHFDRQLGNFSSQDHFTAAVQSGKFPDRNNYLPHIPKKMMKVINKALMVNPLDRYENVLELINELSSIDQMLDWQFFRKQSMFKLDLENKFFEVFVVKNGDKQVYSIRTRKTMKSSGSVQRVKKYCLENVPLKVISKQLKSVLKGIET